MNYSILLSLKGSATRLPPGQPLGKRLRLCAFPTFPSVRAERRVCHFSRSSMRTLARGIESECGGRRPLQTASVTKRFRSRGLRGGFNDEEVAGGSEGPRFLMRQKLWLLRKCCRAVHAGTLMDDSFLYSSKGLAARYAPGALAS